MKIEVSNGELLDKLTILELKIKNIKDTDKLVNVYKEFNELNPLAKELFEKNNSDLQNHYLALAEVNGELWNIEDDIRECERNKDFGDKFIALARAVYITNDKRCEIKKIINITTGSKFIEEKGYEEYEV